MYYFVFNVDLKKPIPTYFNYKYPPTHNFTQIYFKNIKNALNLNCLRPRSMYFF